MIQQQPKIPYNEEAEQGLLGALLADNKVIDRLEGAKPEHFYQPAHQRIFSAIEEKINAGQVADHITIKARFENDNDLAGVGGGDYLSYLRNGIISTVNAPDYLRTIQEAYERRQVFDAADAIKALAISGPDGGLLPEVEKIVNGISGAEEFKTYSAADAVDEALLWMGDVASGKIKPALTGMRDIDNRLGGLFPAGLYVIAARPGMGKTALALSVADNICRSLPVLFFSLEMSRQELTQRLLATRTGIDITSQRKPADLTPDAWARLQDAAKTLPRNLAIDDRAGADISRIRLLGRRMKRKNPHFVMFIDYLGLMKMNLDIRNRVHQIEEITTALKGLAKELQVPIVLLSQLSRAVESRDDQRPNLSDLRDSGSIEQDADAVMFIYREEYYEERKEPKPKSGEKESKHIERLNDWQTQMARCRGKAEIIFGKNRQGKLGSGFLKFDGARQRFE